MYFLAHRTPFAKKMKGIDSVKHDPSAKPADFTIIRQISIFGVHLQSELLKLSMFQALLSHKVNCFNDNVYHILHFQRFCTQRLLVDDAICFCQRVVMPAFDCVFSINSIFCVCASRRQFLILIIFSQYSSLLITFQSQLTSSLLKCHKQKIVFFYRLLYQYNIQRGSRLPLLRKRT